MAFAPFYVIRQVLMVYVQAVAHNGNGYSGAAVTGIPEITDVCIFAGGAAGLPRILQVPLIRKQGIRVSGAVCLIEQSQEQGKVVGATAESNSTSNVRPG